MRHLTCNAGIGKSDRRFGTAHASAPDNRSGHAVKEKIVSKPCYTKMQVTKVTPTKHQRYRQACPNEGNSNITASR